MKNRRIMSGIFALILTVSLCACENSEESSTSEKTSETTVVTTSVTTTAPTPETTAPETTTTTTTTTPQTTITTTKVTTTTKNVTTTAKPKPVTTTKKVTTTTKITTTSKPQNEFDKYVGIYFEENYKNQVHVYDDTNMEYISSSCIEVFLKDGILQAQYYTDVELNEENNTCSAMAGIGSNAPLIKVDTNTMKFELPNGMYFLLEFNNGKLISRKYQDFHDGRGVIEKKEDYVRYTSKLTTDFDEYR